MSDADKIAEAADLEAELGGEHIPTAEELSSVREVAREAYKTMKEIETVEEYLGTLKEKLHINITRTLPDIMAAVGMQSFSTEAGASVEINNYISGSLPKGEEERAAAFDWIRKIKAEGIIKGKIDLEFGKGDNKKMKKVLAYLRRFKEITFNESIGVHPETLKALARERVARGEEVPWETLGLTTGRIAKIILPDHLKPKKKGKRS